jgi:hypothetical protein
VFRLSFLVQGGACGAGACGLRPALTAHRRLARDYERDPALSEAMIRWAAISHDPQDRPRWTRREAATARVHPNKLIFSNTL